MTAARPAPVSFGILGSGFMGHTYAECLARHVPAGRLAAVALGTRAPALAAEYGAAFEASAAALVARPDIDAVIIATPHQTHLPLTRLAAAAGKHVYVEKPMAVSVAECDSMIAACRTANVRLAVNKATRYRESPGTAKRLLDEGRIGPLRMVRIQSSVVDYFPDSKPWAKDPAEGGAWLDNGTHLFDALRWFTGSEVRTVFAQITDFGGLGIRRSGMASLVMQNGVMAQVWISFEIPRPGLGSQSQWLLVGSDGIIEADAFGKVRLGRDTTWEEVFEMPWFDKNRDVYSPIRLKAFATQVQDFTVAIRTGETPTVSGETGRAAVQIYEATVQSALSGEAVHLPPPTHASARP